jgi:hypothetical protein
MISFNESERRDPDGVSSLLSFVEDDVITSTSFTIGFFKRGLVQNIQNMRWVAALFAAEKDEGS